MSLIRTPFKRLHYPRRFIMLRDSGLSNIRVMLIRIDRSLLSMILTCHTLLNERDNLSSLKRFRFNGYPQKTLYT